MRMEKGIVAPVASLLSMMEEALQIKIRMLLGVCVFSAMGVGYFFLR
jgi:hypothetical protein